MCEFVSWVKKRNHVYFLTDRKMATRRGQKLLRSISRDDICGHGTIRAYYGIDEKDGVNKECTDFSSPDNFPPVIVQAIKNGEMRTIGFDTYLLTSGARAKFDRICQPAEAEYDRVRWAARAEYDRVCQAARAKFDFDRVCQPAFWDLFAIPENRIPAWR